MLKVVRRLNWRNVGARLQVFFLQEQLRGTEYSRARGGISTCCNGDSKGVDIGDLEGEQEAEGETNNETGKGEWNDDLFRAKVQ